MFCKKSRYILPFLVSVVFLIPNTVLTQEPNLDFLFRDWAISNNESTNDVVILRNARDTDYLNAEDRKDAYNFAIGLDSVICTKPILRHRGWCGNEWMGKNAESYRLGKEIWALDYEKKLLRFDVYLKESNNEEVPLYSAIYQIKSIGKDYLKLYLKKELYEGVE